MTNKRISVRRRQVLFAVAITDGIASHWLISRSGLSATTVRNVLQDLRRLGLICYRGAWVATPAGKQLVESLRI